MHERHCSAARYVSVGSGLLLVHCLFTSTGGLQNGSVVISCCQPGNKAHVSHTGRLAASTPDALSLSYCNDRVVCLCVATAPSHTSRPSTTHQQLAVPVQRHAASSSCRRCDRTTMRVPQCMHRAHGDSLALAWVLCISTQHSDCQHGTASLGGP